MDVFAFYPWLQCNIAESATIKHEQTLLRCYGLTGFSYGPPGCHLSVVLLPGPMANDPDVRDVGIFETEKHGTPCHSKLPAGNSEPPAGWMISKENN